MNDSENVRTGKYVYIRQIADSIKKDYPIGTRIKLINMDDPYSPVKSGTMGTVDYVDDEGQIHMKWDNGRTLALIYGLDKFEKIEELNLEKNKKNTEVER